MQDKDLQQRAILRKKRKKLGSDEQHMFPKAKTGRPGKDLRLMFNAVLWIACSGAPWRDLPERFGSWKTVYSRFCKWRDEGTQTRPK